MNTDHDGIALDQPATALWGDMVRGELTDRRDFASLDEALRFITSKLPLGSRHTAWVISGGRLVAPEHIPELIGKLAA
jgi:hypothetical protein